MTTVISSRTRNICMTTVTRRRRRTRISVLHVLHDDVVISRLRPKIMTQLMTMTTTQQQQLMNPATPTATPTATATATATATTTATTTGATATVATTNKTMIATGGGSTITATTTHPHHYPHHYPHRYPHRYFSTSTSSSNTSTSSSNTNTSSSNSNESTKSLLSRQEIILSSLEDLKKQNKLSDEIEFSINPYELERHGRGESHHRGFDIHDNKNKYNESSESDPDSKSIQDDSSSIITPDVIVRPSTTNDVSIILKYCNENKIPIIPFGAGTSVEGHVCALHKGTISLDMTYGKEFQSIILPEDIYNNDNDNNNNDSGNESLPDPIAIVGAGVSRKALNEALRHTGMQFVVDPGAANATIGGMVATGASGTTSIKYGTMRENILELKVVLPVNGTICEKIGTKALKSSAGYDLLSLMCGSEVCRSQRDVT
jgi:hypothetical protein